MSIFVADIDSQEAIKGNEISSNGPNLNVYSKSSISEIFMCGQ